MSKYYIYKFYNKNNELLYVGSTNNIGRRLYEHMFSPVSEGWKHYRTSEIMFVKYAVCYDENKYRDYEFYYIDKLKPKYNIVTNNKYDKSIKDDLDFKYSIDVIKFVRNSLKKIYIKQMKKYYGCMYNYKRYKKILEHMIDDTLLRCKNYKYLINK